MSLFLRAFALVLLSANLAWGDAVSVPDATGTTIEVNSINFPSEYAKLLEDSIEGDLNNLGITRVQNGDTASFSYMMHISVTITANSILVTTSMYSVRDNRLLFKEPKIIPSSKGSPGERSPLDLEKLRRHFYYTIGELYNIYRNERYASTIFADCILPPTASETDWGASKLVTSSYAEYIKAETKFSDYLIVGVNPLMFDEWCSNGSGFSFGRVHHVTGRALKRSDGSIRIMLIIQKRYEQPFTVILEPLSSEWGNNAAEQIARALAGLPFWE